MRTRRPGFWVAALWGLANGVLLAVLAVYGESALVYWLWGSVVVLLEVAALAVLAASWTGPEEQSHYRTPRASGACVPPAAAGAALTALSFAYGWWLLILAVPLLAVAGALAVRSRIARGR
ncbi:hypothetical protein ACWGMA_12330 [Streptomyces asiaticus]